MKQDDLATRIEAAEVGTRELSNEVLLACGWRYLPVADIWIAPGDQRRCSGGQQPYPTRDLRDAADLSAAGWIWDVTSTGTAWCMPEYGLGDLHSAKAANPALSLCAAIVRAAARTTP